MVWAGAHGGGGDQDGTLGTESPDSAVRQGSKGQYAGERPTLDLSSAPLSPRREALGRQSPGQLMQQSHR